MGRLRDAIEAGRQAVAARELAQATRAQALLALGLDTPSLVAAAEAHARVAGGQHGRAVLIADHLPAQLVSAPDLIFEHLPPLADLLSAVSPAAADEHRLRRLALILGRWAVTECLWTGGEAEDLVRMAMARAGRDRPAVAFRPNDTRAPVRTAHR